MKGQHGMRQTWQSAYYSVSIFQLSLTSRTLTVCGMAMCSTYKMTSQPLLYSVTLEWISEKAFVFLIEASLSSFCLE